MDHLYSHLSYSVLDALRPYGDHPRSGLGFGSQWVGMENFLERNREAFGKPLNHRVTEILGVGKKWVYIYHSFLTKIQQCQTSGWILHGHLCMTVRMSQIYVPQIISGLCMVTAAEINKTWHSRDSTQSWLEYIVFEKDTIREKERDVCIQRYAPCSWSSTPMVWSLCPPHRQVELILPVLVELVVTLVSNSRTSSINTGSNTNTHHNRGWRG